MVRRLCFGLLIAAAGCGPKVNVDPSPFDEDDPRAGAAIDETRAPTYDELPEAPSGPGAREGVLERAALLAVLDAGPGELLRTFEVAAEHDGERFLGWRVVAFDPDRPRFAGVDLVPGDVLIAINGRSVARPDELQTLWDGLRTADAIVADLMRNGARFQLRWAITPP